MRVGSRSSSGWRRLRPEPSRFWLGWAPRVWPFPDEPFVDLATASLSMGKGEGPALPSRLPAGDPETLYLPPAVGRGEGLVGRWRRSAGAAGFAVRRQSFPGEPMDSASQGGAIDLTPVLLSGDLDRLHDMEPGAAAVWPLIAGLTDDASVVAAGLDRLREAGAVAVQGVVVEIEPSLRRVLAADGDEGLYHALFHGPQPSFVAFARRVVAAELDPWLPRPKLAHHGRRARNRELATHLATLAEWWLLLGRPEGAAQAFFRASRWVEGENADVSALAREGNLTIVDALSEASRREIEVWSAGEGARSIEELARELLDRE